MYLSKSKFLHYENCPFGFKQKYIDKIKEKETPYTWTARAGTDIHKKIEDFFSDTVKLSGMEIINLPPISKYGDDIHMQNFHEFASELLSNAKSEEYFYPVLAEQKLLCESMDINGIPDAVFKNPVDDEYIVVDWKSGKIKTPMDCRRELSFYKLLIDGSGVLDKPIKYLSMYFTKFNHTFFEESKQEDMENIENDIISTQSMIEQKIFPKCSGFHCKWCGYSKKYFGENGCDGE